MCFGSLGSIKMECINCPPGVAPCSLHWLYIGCSLKPLTGSQVLPASSERNRPGGEVPAYQTSGSLSCPGVTQKTESTDRPFSPSGALGNAGGLSDSVQLEPASFDQKTVGPRWPVLAAIMAVLPFLGSTIRW